MYKRCSGSRSFSLWNIIFDKYTHTHTTFNLNFIRSSFLFIYLIKKATTKIHTLCFFHFYAMSVHVVWVNTRHEAKTMHRKWKTKMSRHLYKWERRIEAVEKLKQLKFMAMHLRWQYERSMHSLFTHHRCAGCMWIFTDSQSSMPHTATKNALSHSPIGTFGIIETILLTMDGTERPTNLRRSHIKSDFHLYDCTQSRMYYILYTI